MYSNIYQLKGSNEIFTFQIIKKKCKTLSLGDYFEI